MSNPTPLPPELREAFEAWASDNGQFPKAIQRNGEGYLLAITQLYWTAWQAADKAATERERERAAKVREELEPFGYILHWPRIGGGVEVLFDKSRVAGDAIGCKVTPVYEAVPAVLVNDEAWPKYIAGIIETYIKQNRTNEDRETGIAKIIERRMHSIAATKGTT